MESNLTLTITRTLNLEAELFFNSEFENSING